MEKIIFLLIKIPKKLYKHNIIFIFVRIRFRNTWVSQGLKTQVYLVYKINPAVSQQKIIATGNYTISEKLWPSFAILLGKQRDKFCEKSQIYHEKSPKIDLKYLKWCFYDLIKEMKLEDNFKKIATPSLARRD